MFRGAEKEEKKKLARLGEEVNEEVQAYLSEQGKGKPVEGR